MCQLYSHINCESLNLHLKDIRLRVHQAQAKLPPEWNCGREQIGPCDTTIQIY